MKIIADENIPFVKDAFSDFGDVTLVPGRKITNSLLKSAELLLVRSVTKVNADLLDGTSVKFVGTATIGRDHIDEEYLKHNSIGFASAPGSNADSVAEYLFAVLLQSFNYNLGIIKNKTIGIIGFGNVGSRVYNVANALGMKCLVNDPPKEDVLRSNFCVSLNTIQKEADIITIHVPLNKQDPYSTYHMVNDEFIKNVKPKAMLINASRGAVIDEKALLNGADKFSTIVLDVWENEPNININLLNKVDIATPHIAGYSWDGKVRGTQMIYDAACSFFFKEKTWNMSDVLAQSDKNIITLTNSQNPLPEIINLVYPIMKDDTSLRGIKNMPENKRGEYFDKLRKDYWKRREFFNFSINIDDSCNEKELLKQLGFCLV